jgi:hypothetical protein
MMLDRLAPSAWLLEIVKSLTGVDVARDLVAPFAGRWDKVGAYGEAMTIVSQCVQTVSADVAAISAGLAKQWEGRAADSGQCHLRSLGASLRSDSEVLADTGIRYQELAAAMQCAQAAAEILLKAVLDTAIQVAVCMAAGNVTSRTPAGDVIGYGMATHKTAHLVLLIEEWTRLVEVARTEAAAWTGAQATTG